MSKQRIIIAGGGTGGHIFPALAIANAIKKINAETEILFVGAKGKMEMEKIPQAGYQILGLDIIGFNRSSLIKNIGLPFKLIRSFFQVRKIFKQFQPSAVIGVGGYSSFPVLRYAQWKKIASFIHESNSFAGKSNILLGEKAVKIFTGTDGMEKFFPAGKIMVSGNPVRSSIAESKPTKQEALKFFGLSENKKTILVIGGSLGARTINEAIDAGLNKIMANNIQLIWQTGKPYATRAKQITEALSGSWTNEFITQMENAYAAADIVIARGGAMTVAELCIVQKPALFVPYPFAAEDHQTVNALHLVTKQAALMIKDSEANDQLINTAIDLVNNEQQQQLFITNIAALAKKDADKIIATEILKTINEF